MHNLTKIKIFRLLLWCSYPLSCVFIYPLAVFRKKNQSHLFFFFDRYALGGAQRIHLDILRSVPNLHKQVYFTRKSLNNTLRKEFFGISNTDSKDIHFWCDYLFFRLFSVHYWCFYINRHKTAHIFSANSTFFYDMLPFMSKRFTKTELLHNFTYGKKGMEFFGLANHTYLSYRIVYDMLTKKNIANQYAAFSVPASFLSKILYIEPGVIIPGILPTKPTAPLKILYAGRGGPQKRVWLIDKIAQYFITSGASVEFHFAGNMETDLSETVIKKSVMHGSVSDENIMQKIYQESHVVLLTSAYEGFPMVIKEGMAYGCIPVVTALEGNKTHLTDNTNALFINELQNEEKIIQEGIVKIESLANNPELLLDLSRNCRKYAEIHFDKKKFSNAYKYFLSSI